MFPHLYSPLDLSNVVEEFEILGCGADCIKFNIGFNDIEGFTGSQILKNQNMVDYKKHRAYNMAFHGSTAGGYVDQIINIPSGFEPYGTILNPSTIYGGKFDSKYEASLGPAINGNAVYFTELENDNFIEINFSFNGIPPTNNVSFLKGKYKLNVLLVKFT